MTKQVQRRRGTSTQHTSFTGAEGEISVNTTNKSIHVHDGITAGGVEAARADLTNVSDANLNAALSGNTLSSLTITSVDINGGTIDGAVIGGSAAAAGTFTTVTASGDVTIADKIVHSGDTNTAIRFPAADTVTVETSGAERLRVDSSGNVGIGINAPIEKLDVRGAIFVGDVASGINYNGMILDYNTSTREARLAVGATSGGSSFFTFTTANGGVEGERMRITSAGNVGIGTSSPSQRLHVAGAVYASGDGSDVAFYMDGSDAIRNTSTGGIVYHDVAFGSATHGQFVFRSSNAATERMRIDSSGNVGIGTSTMPAGRRLVVSGGNIRLDTDYQIEWGGSTVGLYGHGANNTLHFFTNTTERMRIDASGNLGLGVTPSAWGSGYRTAQLGNQGASISGNTTISQAVLGSNGFYNGTNWIYNNSDSAGQYRLDGNVHKWYTAPSGPAGNAITFTQAMTLDASGNLGVGVTSPSAKLELQGNSTVASIKYLADGGSALLSWKNSSGTTLWSIGGGIATSQDELAFVRQSTTVAKFDASGNLGLGVTPSAWGGVFKAFDVNSGGSYSGTSSTARMFGNSYYNGSSYIYKSSGYANYYYCGDGQHAWFNAPSGTAGNAITFTQAMTLDASGNLLVGTTVTPTGATGGAGFVRESASRSTLYCATTAGTSAGLINFVNPNGTVGFIATNGTATTYSTSSDYRLKENVQPMQDALGKIAQLNPVTYTWKVDGSAGQGFIAHELQAVVPDCVTGEKDAVDAEGNPQYQGVDTSFLVATLVKAIQELTARVAELENR